MITIYLLTSLAFFAHSQEMGTITGKLGYPAEELPPMVVCAETLTHNPIEAFCKNTEAGIRPFSLEVPPGVYHVYAHLQHPLGSTQVDERAYYNEFVKCGLNAKCPSHDPISVTVESGKTVKGIDPVDWYRTVRTPRSGQHP